MPLSIMRQVLRLFQSEFSTQRDLVLHLARIPFTATKYFFEFRKMEPYKNVYAWNVASRMWQMSAVSWPTRISREWPCGVARNAMSMLGQTAASSHPSWRTGLRFSLTRLTCAGRTHAVDIARQAAVLLRPSYERPNKFRHVFIVANSAY